MAARGDRKLELSQRQAMAREYQYGNRSIRDLAAAYGVAYITANKYLHELLGPLRSRGGNHRR